MNVATEMNTGPAEGIVLTDGESSSSRLADGQDPAKVQPPLSAANVLPNSLLKMPKNAQLHRGMNWVPIFCANCGKPGGSVPEDHCDFAFYLCEPCAEKLGPVMGTYAEPDVLFWRRVNEAQMEEFGRILTADEQVEALKDEKHILAKLARDRK
jgi:hypothetical protein